MADVRQYLRRVKVEIEDANRAVLTVEELRVVFDIRQERQSSPSPSTVKIYNLGQASASHISEPGQLVRVWAGYGEISDADSLFEGETRRVLHERAGLDRVTTIVLGGSDSATNGAVVNRSIEGPVDLHDVIREVVNKMGLEIGPLDAIPDEELADGYQYNGSAKTALTRLLEPRGVTPYVVSGAMHFALGGGDATGTQFRLTRFTGLIGTPSATENDGARAKMALNNGIELGQPVEIRSDALEGYYKVTSIAHRGDSWAGEFVTEIEGTKADPPLEGVEFVRDFSRGVA